ncbi:hypothetical protein ACFV4K_23265 [Nocardia sp. NPDC059764]
MSGRLRLAGSVTGNRLREAMIGDVLGQAELTGTYTLDRTRD